VTGVSIIESLRFALLGALLAACIHAARVLLRHRDDMLRRTLVAWAFGMIPIVLGRALMFPPWSNAVASVGTHLHYSGMPVIAVGVILLAGRLERRLFAATMVLGLLATIWVWVPGMVFTSTVVTRHSGGEIYATLELARGAPLHVAVCVFLGIVASWSVARRSDIDVDLRAVALVGVVLQVSLGLNDTLLDLGLSSTRIGTGWGAAFILTLLGGLLVRRFVQAHSGLATQIQASVEELAEEHRQLETKEHLGALGALVAGIGHEVNNPLASIAANLDYLDHEVEALPLSEREREHVERGLDRARHHMDDIRMAMQDFTTSNQVSRPSRPQADREEAPSSEDRRNRLRALVVDDDPFVCRALTRTLHDYDVTTVASGEEALVALSEQSFDVVLCDVMMPGMSGIELYDAIGEHHPNMRDAMVFLTGGTFSQRESARLEALEAPVLSKPADPELLRRALAERAKPPSSRRGKAM